MEDQKFNLNEESKRVYSLKVADHITAMLAYWDKDLVCRFANKAYEHWFNKTSEEMVNKITLPELLGPLYEKNLPYISAALEGNEQVFEREIRNPGTGIVRHAIANYFPDVQDGVVQGFFVHVADVTQMKELEFALVEKENDLQQSYEIIKEQNSRLLNFAHLISHNLRTHASNLSGLLGMYADSKDQEERTQIISFLKDLSLAFNETVSNLNMVSDAKSNHHVHKQYLNLHQYIERTLESLALNISSTNAIILNNVSNTLEVYYNPAYLESILLNLLTNAIKYRQPDKTPVIDLSVGLEENWIILRVADNGMGIDMQRFGSKLFGMYKTFHGNTDAKGVGLFITKYHAEAMGGNIVVESVVGQGSTFNLYIKSVLQR
jgi:signal transduction histidine kinase